MTLEVYVILCTFAAIFRWNGRNPRITADCTVRACEGAVVCAMCLVSCFLPLLLPVPLAERSPAVEPWGSSLWTGNRVPEAGGGDRPQRLTESSNPTQHAKGRTGNCPGPRKETTTRRNVTQGVSSMRYRTVRTSNNSRHRGDRHAVKDSAALLFGGVEPWVRLGQGPP